MKAEEALKAVLNLDGVSDDIREVLTGLDLSNMVTNDASNARAAADRKKAEKRAAEALARIEELEAIIEESKDAGLGEIEKAQKAMKKAEERALAAEHQAKENADKLNSQARTIALGKAAKAINFSSNISPEVREMMINHTFAGIDTEDLENVALVEPLVKGFIQANEAIIIKQDAGGAGSKGGGAPAASQKFTRAGIAAMTQKEREANEPAIVEAFNRGEVE